MTKYFLTAALASIVAVAQPPRGPAPTPELPTSTYARAYPQRAPGDPAQVARGKEIFEINCAFCHGSDARGGDGGPNLVRAQIVLADDKGETIGPVVREGRAAQGMPKFDFSSAQMADIAAFLHSFRVSGYDVTRYRPPSIVVGSATAGEAYFKSKCASCHSPTGDLKGIATRFEDPRTLQQRWLMSNGGRAGSPIAPASVTVTLPSGAKSEGKLVRIDDFIVSLIDADGATHTYRRDGDTPKVEMRDPLQGHKDLLKVYADKDIHDVTAYLVTLK